MNSVMPPGYSQPQYNDDYDPKWTATLQHFRQYASARKDWSRPRPVRQGGPGGKYSPAPPIRRPGEPPKRRIRRGRSAYARAGGDAGDSERGYHSSSPRRSGGGGGGGAGRLASLGSEHTSGPGGSRTPRGTNLPRGARRAAGAASARRGRSARRSDRAYANAVSEDHLPEEVIHQLRSELKDATTEIGRLRHKLKVAVVVDEKRDMEIHDSVARYDDELTALRDASRRERRDMNVELIRLKEEVARKDAEVRVLKHANSRMARTVAGQQESVSSHDLFARAVVEQRNSLQRLIDEVRDSLASGAVKKHELYSKLQRMQEAVHKRDLVEAGKREWEPADLYAGHLFHPSIAVRQVAAQAQRDAERLAYTAEARHLGEVLSRIGNFLSLGEQSARQLAMLQEVADTVQRLVDGRKRNPPWRLGGGAGTGSSDSSARRASPSGKGRYVEG